MNYDELGPMGDKLAGQGGETLGIYRLSGNLAGLLFKHYKETAAHGGRAEALKQLVEFGRGTAASGRHEREILLKATSWPVESVTDAHGTLIGCLIPEAGKKFRSDTGKLREIDTLAQTDDRLALRGLRVSPEQRLAVCRQIAEAAAALERCGLVYSDWNYANALWCPDDSSVFIIDIDGCRFGEMPNICQSGWEDPLTGATAPADKFTDRFRVALLTARCLTGERHLISVLHALADADDRRVPGRENFRENLRENLLDMLWAEDRKKRPPTTVLSAVLNGAGVRFGPPERRPLPAALPTPRPGPLRPSPPKNPPQPKPSASNSGALVGVVLLFVTVTVIVIVIIVAATR